MPQATNPSIPQFLSIQQVAAQVVALINSSPSSPRQEEIEAVIAKAISPAADIASPLLAKIRETATRLEDAYDAYGKLTPKDPTAAAVQARLDCAHADLEELERQIPSPPQSFIDLLCWAEITRAGAGIHPDGTIAETQECDVFERPAARLMEAVLQMGGRQS